MRLAGRISQKGQVTVPKKERDAIGVAPGDHIVYEIEANTVTLRRLEAFDAGFHAALARTLDEWSTPEDEQAFRDL